MELSDAQEGDLINEFHDALTDKEWVRYHKKMNKVMNTTYGNLNRTDVINGKIITTEIKNHKEQVTNVNKLTKEFTNKINYVIEEANYYGYNGQELQNYIEELYGKENVIRYDISSGKYVRASELVTNIEDNNSGNENNERNTIKGIDEQSTKELENSSFSLEQRLSGDELLNAQEEKQMLEYEKINSKTVDEVAKQRENGIIYQNGEQQAKQILGNDNPNNLDFDVKEGDLVNQFYNSLTKNEWRTYHNKMNEILRNSYGEFTRIDKINNKLVATEFINGKEQVIDVYNVNQTTNNLTNFVIEEVNNYGHYDRKQIQNFIKEMYGEENVSRFDTTNSLYELFTTSQQDSGNAIGESWEINGRTNENISSKFDKTKELKDSSFFNNIGYHYGDLGKGNDTNYFSMTGTRRSSGHLGYGTYFVSSEESNVGTKADRGTPKQININEYNNLFTPNNKQDMDKLYNALKDIDNNELNAMDLLELEPVLNTNYETLYNAINKVNEYRDNTEKVNSMKQLEMDSPATVFMKELGYNGIDTRSIPEYDNSEFGSVIYDLDNKTSNEDIRKSKSNILPKNQKMVEFTNNQQNKQINKVLEETIKPLHDTIKQLQKTIEDLQKNNNANFKEINAKEIVSNKDTIKVDNSELSNKTNDTNNLLKEYDYTKKEENINETDEAKIAEILTESPKNENDRNSLKRKIAIARASILDKGSVFEDLSLKTKNRELQAKWDSTLTSKAKAQNIIGNGYTTYDAETQTTTKNSKSLYEIQEQVNNTGLTKEFYEYMYHKHNVDRMTLDSRYEGRNK